MAVIDVDGRTLDAYTTEAIKYKQPVHHPIPEAIQVFHSSLPVGI